MAKRLKYNSDYMSNKMDSYMEQIEDKLSALYADAAKEMQEKLTDFMDGYEKQRASMEAKVEAGKMTEEEYSQWCNRHIVQSEKYKSTIDSLSTMAVNADVAAMAMVDGAMPMVVAQSYNFTQALGFEAADKAGLTQGTFQIYNERSVQKLLKDNPNLLKEVDMDADKKWNTEKMNREITQGIIQGEPIEKIADRLQRVTDMDRNAAVRNARTMMTGAENMGRAEAADDLKAQGIPMDEVWSATYDNRTRESHLELDGTVRDENGLFGADFLAHPLRYPADPEGDPEEIYNCRCRLSLQLVGVDHSKDQELYENFMKENFPQTWETMQEKDSIKNALETYSKKQEEMPPRPTREMIPAPEKIELTDSEEKSILPNEDTSEPKEDTNMTNPDNLSDGVLEIIGDKKEPIEAETLMATINPNYPNENYTNNCQRCASCYELGRRGYDVEAMAFDGHYYGTSVFLDQSTQFKSGVNFGTYITGEKYDPRFASSEYPFNRSPKTTANSIVNAMTDWGDGSRATLTVTWRNGGGNHIVNVENFGGDVRIIDTQCGKSYDDIERYLSATKCAETELRRTDILEFREEISEDDLKTICKARD